MSDDRNVHGWLVTTEWCPLKGNHFLSTEFTKKDPGRYYADLAIQYRDQRGIAESWPTAMLSAFTVSLTEEEVDFFS